MSNAKTSHIVQSLLVNVAIALAKGFAAALTGSGALLAEPGGPITEILSLITLQQGPGEVVLATKVRIAGALGGDDVARAINQFEQAVHDRCPEVRWLFVEPDIEA